MRESERDRERGGAFLTSDCVCGPDEKDVAIGASLAFCTICSSANAHQLPPPPSTGHRRPPHPTPPPTSSRAHSRAAATGSKASHSNEMLTMSMETKNNGFMFSNENLQVAKFHFLLPRRRNDEFWSFPIDRPA